MMEQTPRLWEARLRIVYQSLLGDNKVIVKETTGRANRHSTDRKVESCQVAQGKVLNSVDWKQEKCHRRLSRGVNILDLQSIPLTSTSPSHPRQQEKKTPNPNLLYPNKILRKTKRAFGQGNTTAATKSSSVSRQRLSIYS